jgi:hypothetical protein
MFSLSAAEAVEATMVLLMLVAGLVALAVILKRAMFI